jgi:uncharacterized membrane protein
MPEPAAFIERYRTWAYAMRDAFKSILVDYPYDFDPFWVRAEPYRVKVRAGESVELSVIVRNFRSRVQTHHVEVHTPSGLSADPSRLDGELPAETRKPFRIKLNAAAEASPGVRIVAFDVTLDGRRYGEIFDAIVEVIR